MQHLDAFNAGYAPRILGRTDLPGGFICVAMELLDKSIWTEYVCGSANQETKNAVLTAKENVHGDLRRGNVLIRTNSSGKVDGVKFLDFDWAGKAGEARFQVRANPKA
jgi:hypothetical protein